MTSSTSSSSHWLLLPLLPNHSQKLLLLPLPSHTHRLPQPLLPNHTHWLLPLRRYCHQSPAPDPARSILEGRSRMYS
jgi:hypothetical protein